MMIEKLLPQNIEAECGVLGSLIIDPEAIAQVADFLQADDFYRNAHRTIYEIMLRFFDRHEPADFIELCDELTRRNMLEEVGGSSYISSLVNQVPTSGNVEFYGRIVERTAVLRRLIHGAGQIAACAYEQAEDAYEQSERIIYAIGTRRGQGDFEAMTEITSGYLNELDYLHEHRGRIVGVPTGLYALDGIVGGMQKSDLIILAARPSQGKTSLALTVAHNAAINYNKSVGIFSLEMSKRQLAQRMVAMTAPVDLQKLRTGWIEERDWDKIVAAVDTLSEGKLWIADTTGLSIAAMRSKCRRLQARHGLDLLIVDYLQLMQSADPKQHANRVQEISDISRGLKLLAMELDIPILALSQLSRNVEQRATKVPQLSDLRDSGSLEQDADVVLFIYRDEVYSRETAKKGIADIIIAKHRNGPVGEISLGFELAQTRFYNLEELAEIGG